MVSGYHVWNLVVIYDNNNNKIVLGWAIDFRYSKHRDAFNSQHNDSVMAQIDCLYPSCKGPDGDGMLYYNGFSLTIVIYLISELILWVVKNFFQACPNSD